MFSWLNPKLSLKDSTEAGKGVVVRGGQVTQGELLAIFGGHVMTLAEERALPEGIRDLPLQIAPGFVIGVRSHTEVETSDFFNHSCDPNSGIRGQILLMAMRDILEGEQVMFDYATVLTAEGGYESFTFKCHCGTTQCRGTISASDWKIPALQARYRGWFSTYLQDRIDSLPSTSVCQ